MLSVFHPLLVFIKLVKSFLFSLHFANVKIDSTKFLFISNLLLFISRGLENIFPKMCVQETQLIFDFHLNKQNHYLLLLSSRFYKVFVRNGHKIIHFNNPLQTDSFPIVQEYIFSISEQFSPQVKISQCFYRFRVNSFTKNRIICITIFRCNILYS